MNSKLILKSKTIIGILLATLVMWAPQFGFDFSQADSNFVMENLNELVATGLALFAGYGRMVAETKLRFGGE